MGYFGQFDRFRFRMSFHGTREKFSKECVEFLPAIARDGTSEAPDDREEKQAL